VHRKAPLVVDGREVVECGVAAVRVVPPLDEFEDGQAGLELCLEADVVEEFVFECREEALA
jgi:hypothetical protein